MILLRVMVWVSLGATVMVAVLAVAQEWPVAHGWFWIGFFGSLALLGAWAHALLGGE